MGWRKTETKNATTWVADDVIPKGWPTPQGQRAIGTAISRGQQAPGALPFSRMSREEPTQIAAVESHVTVPLLWSLITGGIISLLVLPLFIVLESPYWWLAFWIGALAMLMMWLHRIGGLDVVMWKVENIVGKDISGDGVVGKPETVRVEVTEHTPAGGRISYLDLPLPEEALGTFVRGTLNGVPLAREHWTGAGKSMSRKGFEQVVDQMIEKGWARYRDGGKTQGLELTPAGRAMFRHAAESLAGVGRQAAGMQNQDGSADGVVG